MRKPKTRSRQQKRQRAIRRDGDGLLDKKGTAFALEMMIMPGSAPVAQFAQIVQAELRKVGVRITIRMIDGAAQVQQIRAGDFESAYLGWELDADPSMRRAGSSTR